MVGVQYLIRACCSYVNPKFSKVDGINVQHKTSYKFSSQLEILVSQTKNHEMIVRVF